MNIKNILKGKFVLTDEMLEKNINAFKRGSLKIMEERNRMNECWRCKYKRGIPGDAHIRCTNPDPEVEGYPHGIKNGWFTYPSYFDPIWKIKDCNNFDLNAPCGDK